MKTCSIVINARLQSTRLPKKMIRPFCNTTLIDIALSKINIMDFFDYRFLAVGEDKLKEKLVNYKNVELIEREGDEIRRGIINLETRFRFFKKIPTDYVILLNACCPMTSVSTIQEAYDIFQESNYLSYTSGIETRDWIFDQGSNCLTRIDASNVATNFGEIFYKATHMFHIINVKRFLDEGILWTYKNSDPYIIKVSEEEYVDIDNERDFLVAEFLYNRSSL